MALVMEEDVAPEPLIRSVVRPAQTACSHSGVSTGGSAAAQRSCVVGTGSAALGVPSSEGKGGSLLVEKDVLLAAAHGTAAAAAASTPCMIAGVMGPCVPPQFQVPVQGPLPALASEPGPAALCQVRSMKAERGRRPSGGRSDGALPPPGHTQGLHGAAGGAAGQGGGPGHGHGHTPDRPPCRVVGRMVKSASCPGGGESEQEEGRGHGPQHHDAEHHAEEEPRGCGLRVKGTGVQEEVRRAAAAEQEETGKLCGGVQPPWACVGDRALPAEGGPAQGVHGGSQARGQAPLLQKHALGSSLSPSLTRAQEGAARRRAGRSTGAERRKEVAPASQGEEADARAQGAGGAPAQGRKTRKKGGEAGVQEEEGGNDEGEGRRCAADGGRAPQTEHKWVHEGSKEWRREDGVSTVEGCKGLSPGGTRGNRGCQRSVAWTGKGVPVGRSKEGKTARLYAPRAGGGGADKPGQVCLAVEEEAAQDGRGTRAAEGEEEKQLLEQQQLEDEQEEGVNASSGQLMMAKDEVCAVLDFVLSNGTEGKRMDSCAGGGMPHSEGATRATVQVSEVDLAFPNPPHRSTPCSLPAPDWMSAHPAPAPEHASCAQVKFPPPQPTPGPAPPMHGSPGANASARLAVRHVEAPCVGPCPGSPAAALTPEEEIIEAELVPSCDAEGDSPPPMGRARGLRQRGTTIFHGMTSSVSAEVGVSRGGVHGSAQGRCGRVLPADMVYPGRSRGQAMAVQPPAKPAAAAFARSNTLEVAFCQSWEGRRGAEARPSSLRPETRDEGRVIMAEVIPADCSNILFPSRSSSPRLDTWNMEGPCTSTHFSDNRCSAADGRGHASSSVKYVRQSSFSGPVTSSTSQGYSHLAPGRQAPLASLEPRAAQPMDSPNNGEPFACHSTGSIPLRMKPARPATYAAVKRPGQMHNHPLFPLATEEDLYGDIFAEDEQSCAAGSTPQVTAGLLQQAPPPRPLMAGGIPRSLSDVRHHQPVLDDGSVQKSKTTPQCKVLPAAAVAARRRLSERTREREHHAPRERGSRLGSEQLQPLGSTQAETYTGAGAVAPGLHIKPITGRTSPCTSGSKAHLGRTAPAQGPGVPRSASACAAAPEGQVGRRPLGGSAEPMEPMLAPRSGSRSRERRAGSPGQGQILETAGGSPMRVRHASARRSPMPRALPLPLTTAAQEEDLVFPSASASAPALHEAANPGMPLRPGIQIRVGSASGQGARQRYLVPGS